MNRVWKFLKSRYFISLNIITLLFTFFPESAFTYGVVHVEWPIEAIITCNRLLWLLVVFTVACVIELICIKKRKSVEISKNGYSIVVEYADIFDKTDCMKVINFDECYSTHIGKEPADIKPWSICGQFLTKYSHVDFRDIVANSGLKTKMKHSEYNNSKCYESGSVITFDDYLLMAFTKLDKEGNGRMSRAEYLLCLDLLWKGLQSRHNGRSVALPVLGSGIVKFKDETLLPQQLLDMIIASYKMTPYKLKYPAQLRIVTKNDGKISLNRIGEYI